MGDYTQICRIISVIIFLCHRLSFAFDVHLNLDTSATGTTLFNASLGPGWSYKLRPAQAWQGNANRHVKFLSVDHDTGHVFLKSLPKCRNKQQNPYTVYVISETKDFQTSRNYSMIPINVHLHGQNCFTKFRRKSDRKLYKVPVLGFHLNWRKGACISTNSNIVNLSQNLPQSLRKCILGYRTDSREYKIDPDGSLRTLHDVCMDSSSLVVRTTLTTVCGAKGFDYPMIVKVILLSSDGPEQHPFLLHHSIKRLQRMKRETNEHMPIFPEAHYVRRVPEEKPPGVLVATITATDDDKGPAGQIEYKLFASRDARSQAMFKIDQTSGRITTTQTLDREAMDTHYFIIYAVDGGSSSLKRTGQATLTIKVDDVNDHTPHFEKLRYFQQEPETAGIGSTILTIRATDKDLGKNQEIRYSIVNPEPPNDVFNLDETSGTITTAKKLDRETTEQYTLIVKAQDQSPQFQNRREATATVVIAIKDMNDNYPQFEKRSYTISVKENIDWKTRPVIDRIKATDADLGSNGLIRYSITGGNSGGTFKINEVTGDLSVVKPLNYEKVKQYDLKVRAQDSGSPAKTNSTTVLVLVEDVNDHAPRFIRMNFHEIVAEDVDPGHTICRVEAIDPDSGANSVISYSITNAPPNMPVVIDSKTGWIKTSGALDREKADHYTFNVMAKDHGTPPLSASATVKITISDVNDNAPKFNPSSYETAISEETARLEPVLTVTAKDADAHNNARIMYRISSGNFRQAFNIHSQSGLGVISVQRQLNYNEKNRYVLTVTATDPGGLSASCTVIVNITDANTYRPTFVNTPYVAKVKEDVALGHSIFQVSATDDDVGENARISYTMDNSDVFRIDPITGKIYTKKKLDRETTHGYTISIKATDHGKPEKSDTTEVEIQVIDVNDNYPEFKKRVYSGQIKEDAIVGTSVLTISAVDKDQGSNGQVQYTFDGGDNGDGDFSIDPTLGVIRTARLLDRERVANYKLEAYAVDRGASLTRSTGVKINIRVTDKNDNAPQFDSLVINLDINENEPIGSTVGKIIARDPDEGANAHVVYSISGGPDRNLFKLGQSNDDSAVILTAKEFDYEYEKRDFEITLRATSTPLFSEARVFIHVKDVNDNRPELQNFRIVFYNYKDDDKNSTEKSTAYNHHPYNHFPTGNIGRVPAYDRDVSDKLQYRFLSGNEGHLLHLNRTTGMIRLDSRLNSDVPRNGTLKVVVSDGINEVERNCELSVRLVTTNMLANGITVRLNNMTQTEFLSHLYDLFLSGLASILETDKRNIFITNVQQDTDVKAKVLNVSFSVRKMIRNNREYYHNPEDLREKVYLRRSLLAQLSTAQVLPFDDNLCVTEPCLNNEICIDILKFGNASSFLTSDTMLFRPIRPVNGYRCLCPKSFTGMKASYMCDTEVNLCYSGPCGGNGTCVQKEGGFTCVCKPGFTGHQCQYDMRNKNYTKKSCPKSICRPPSQCTPRTTGSGFTCEGCPNKEYHTKFCQVTTRGFTKGTFLMFPSLGRSYRFRIRLRFATHEKNGLLFYNGRYNEKHDFVALEIDNGQVRFSFSLGANITTVASSIEGGVHDGKWHEVTVDYLNRTVTLTVGEECDPALAIHNKDQYRSGCAVTATHVLESRCATVTECCHRNLDLTSPLQIGGLPTLQTEFQVKNKDFVGCMKDFYIDDEFLDLSSYVFNNGTVEGCPSLQKFCDTAPCANGGTCHNGWGTRVCSCPPEYGGKDCNQRIPKARHFAGDGYMAYRLSVVIQLPWYNGIAFRTTKDSGLLMQVQLGSTAAVILEVKSGYIYYTYAGKVIVFDSMKVNDGKWHFIEVRWLTTGLILSLDYGQVEIQYDVSTYVNGKTVSEVYVGGLLVKRRVEKAWTGCIENVRLGGSQNAMLGAPSQSFNTKDGCPKFDPCARALCPTNSDCVNKFDTHVCVCHKGYFGPLCSEICETANPCQYGATCRTTASTTHGYRCECTEFHSGQYCENLIGQPCPSTWWGYPICGPCNCPKGEGLNPSCNKSTGECACLPNYYLAPGKRSCRRCDCYHLGSVHGACHHRTGQCLCKPRVVGRKCNQCGTKIAEVKKDGCEIVFKQCPRNWKDNIWWDREDYGVMQIKSCPFGTVGKATRFCSQENIWSDPDTFNCMSIDFNAMLEEIMKMEKGLLEINTFQAKTSLWKLNKAMKNTEVLYGSDVYAAYRLIKMLLIYENKQSGLNLTHTQDKNFIQMMMNALDRMFSPENLKIWRTIQKHSGGSAADLMNHLEKYVGTLAKNMEVTLTPAFDVVTNNLVLGVDKIVKKLYGNETSIPKYNNKVLNTRIFDKTTRIVMPKSVYDLKGVLSGLNNKLTDDADVGYIFYKTLGEILPKKYAKSVRIPRKVPLKVNSPVISLTLLSNNEEISGKLPEPIVLEMKQLTDFNRTSPQCVYWEYTNRTSGAGRWSSEGCAVVNRTVMKVGPSIVTCRCNHLTSFGVLMDESSVELKHWYGQGPVTVEIITYVGLAISCTCLFLAMLLLCCLRRLQNNMHSIHINLMFCIFVGEILYMGGIGQTEPQLMCRIVAIFLHFFFTSAFAWMFVESLHLYRMMTEIRDINTGSMKFYYAVGYLIPGIIVGLAVGLKTDGYGNINFCWLSTRDQLIWSFVGPVCVVYVMNVVVFFMALKASFNVKSEDEQHLFRIGLVAAMFLLPLLGMAWVFGILSVNENSKAFHYLFAIFCLLQGVFLLLGHIILNPRARWELKRAWAICHGAKEEDLDGDLSATRTTTMSRSALAYHQDSSIHDGLGRINMGISTTSTTSRSTSKTSSGGYKPDGFTRSTGSTTTSKDVPSEFQNPAFGFDSSFFNDKPVGDPDTGEVSRRRRHDSDSDSDLSIGRASLDLASSHSSDDDDDDDDDMGWGQLSVPPKNKVLERVKAQTKPKGPQHSTPIVPPQYNSTKPTWQGELALSTTSESDVLGPTQVQVKIAERKGSPEKKISNGHKNTAPPSRERSRDKSIDLDSSNSTRGSVDQPMVRHVPPPYDVAIGSRSSTPASITGSPNRPLSPNTSFPSRSMSPLGGTPPRSTSSPQTIQPAERPLSPSRHLKSPLAKEPPPVVAPKPRPAPRISVQVLTHNGSTSSTDEVSNLDQETSV